MPTTILLHLTNEDPIIGEIDDLPTAGDVYLGANNPR